MHVRSTPGQSLGLTTVPMVRTASNFPLFAIAFATTGSSKLPGTQTTWKYAPLKAELQPQRVGFVSNRSQKLPCAENSNFLGEKQVQNWEQYLPWDLLATTS